MELHLIRHTKTVAPTGMCYGQSDLDLEAVFEDQFDQIFIELQKICPSPAAIWSSPLKRCRILGDFLVGRYARSDLQLQLDSNLMELNFGEWECRNYNEIPQAELSHWMADLAHVAPPGGESYLQLHSRVKHFYWNMLHQKPEKTQPDRNSQTNPHVIVVTHGGVVRCFLELLLSSPLEKSFNLQIQYGKILSFRLADPE